MNENPKPGQRDVDPLVRFTSRLALSPRHMILGYLAFFALVLALVLGGLDPYAEGTAPSPEAVHTPYFSWVFNYGIPATSLLCFVVFTIQSLRRKTLTWWWLFFVAGASCFWVESIGDWGFYLSYSPEFFHYRFPLAFPWHVQENPFFMPFAYGVYWSVHAWALIKLTKWMSVRTSWSELRCLLLLCLPIGYGWDFLVEGTATYFGWWQYAPPLGPYISWEFLGGLGNMPLTFPILIMMGWPNFIAWLAGDPDAKGPGGIERLYGLPRFLPQQHPVRLVGPGNPKSAPKAELLFESWCPRYEAMRVLAWIITFWITTTLMQLVPIIAIRYLFGHQSIFAPWPI